MFLDKYIALRGDFRGDFIVIRKSSLELRFFSGMDERDPLLPRFHDFGEAFQATGKNG